MNGVAMFKSLVATLLLAGTMVMQVDAVKAISLEKSSFAELPGWQDDNHREALEVFVSACRELTTSGVGFARKSVLSGKKSDWLELCYLAGATNQSGQSAREFFEKYLVPVKINNTKGQFTGYFEPEIKGSRTATEIYNVPVLSRPHDFQKLPSAAASKLQLGYGRKVGGKWQPYLTRKQIEQGALAGKNLEIVYLSSWEDLFFTQIQGSGRVALADGGTMRLAYAAKTGLPYTSIGKVLIDRGVMTREGMSMQALRSWLEKNREQARAVMWENQSYVFFRELKDAVKNSGPIGAQKLPLTPLRSLAVDRGYWALGVPIWVSTTVYLQNQQVDFNRVMVAQDTGTAIRGAARGDVFMGTGAQAGLDAGRMDQAGSMTALLPRGLGSRLLKKYGQ